MFAAHARQALGQPLDALLCAMQIRMLGPVAFDFDFEAVEPGEVNAIGEAGAAAQVVEAAAADDAHRGASLHADAIDQIPALIVEARRARIGIELGESAVEIKQQQEGGTGGPVHHLGLHLI